MCVMAAWWVNLDHEGLTGFFYNNNKRKRLTGFKKNGPVIIGPF